jgi:methionyl-tRNA synthetase
MTAMNAPRKILVTAALPYANGSIHLGHMLEYIQTDIWVRFQRALGHEVWFAWADDAHGTPIMLHAQKRGITPEQLINEMSVEHQRDFRDFHLSYDEYGSTHSNTNQQLVERIWDALSAKGLVESKVISQYFDPQAKLFLPDRFIRGTCSKCRTPDQAGDACDHCGSSYDPTEVIDPISVLSGSTPILQETEHFFVALEPFRETLWAWMGSGAVQTEVSNKLLEWFGDTLRPWDVTRDAPYFGFPIPGHPGKFFYVWLDAPVGYLASFQSICDREGLDFEAWMAPDTPTEMHHFIGKDIIYFHCLFWPAMLSAAEFRLPTEVHAHGFLTVNGAKMSKSRGTFIKARTWLEHVNPDTLRYYFAAKLTPGLGDIDLSLEDFKARVNSDLVGKLVNIASRCSGFIHKFGDGRLSPTLPEPELYERFLKSHQSILDDYEHLNFAGAIRQIMQLTDEANQYIDHHKPWQMAKEEGREKEVVQVCSQGINFFRLLMTWLSPVIPMTSSKAAQFLACKLDRFDQIQTPLCDHQIQAFEPLMQRVDQAQLDAVIEASKESLGS